MIPTSSTSAGRPSPSATRPFRAASAPPRRSLRRTTSPAASAQLSSSPRRTPRGSSTASPTARSPAKTSISARAPGGTLELLAQSLALAARGLPELLLEGGHPGPPVRRGVAFTRAEDPRREQPGLTRTADRDGRNRHARGNMHDREQRIHSVQMLQRHGHPDDRQRRDRGEHARQVGGPAGAGDEDSNAALFGLLPVGDHLRGHPVCTDDLGFEGEVEFLERAGGFAHDRPIGIGAPDEADEGVHAISLQSSRGFCPVWAAGEVSASSSPAPSPRNSATAARARASIRSGSFPVMVTCPSLRPGRTDLPYRCTFASGYRRSTSG